MLINGKQINIPFRRTIVIPRVEEDIVFTAIAVSCEDDFNRLCKEPQAPKIYKNNKFDSIDYEDPKYLKDLREHSTKRLDYIIIRSLENIQWETVDLEDSDTWKNWRKECSNSGLSDFEIGRLLSEVMDTHNPSEDLIKKMRENFLSTQTHKDNQENQDSQDTDQENT